MSGCIDEIENVEINPNRLNNQESKNEKDNLDVRTEASNKIGRSRAVGARVGSRDGSSAVLSTLKWI